MLLKMLNTRCLLVFTIITYSLVYQTLAQEGTCRTPNGVLARCVSIRDCSHFITAIKSRIPSQINFIKSSQCGWDTTALVCCGNDTDYVTAPAVSVGRTTNNNLRRNSAIPGRNSCGFQESDNGVGGFIFAGKEAEIDEFPWMAILQYTDRYGKIRSYCGGTLISSRYVLTAAHCVTGTILRIAQLNNVKLGDHDINTEIDCDKNSKCNTRPVTVGVEEVTYHPNYTGSSFSPNDIALVRLKQRVSFSNFIRPICLPEPTEASTVGDYLSTAGWGKIESGNTSSVLLKVEVPFYDKNRCTREYYAQGVPLHDSQICAGGQEGKDSCNGDSGGPLMRRSVRNPLQWYQEGIVSFGAEECGSHHLSGVYTKISDFLPWIYSTVRDI